MTSRLANLLGFLACVGLLGFALFAQFVMHLDPCPLCIFQRIGILVIGLLFMCAAVQGPKNWGRRVYAVAIGLAALATMSISMRHLYIQSLPPGSIAACGAPLGTMLQYLPLNQVLFKVLNGSGECQKVDWRLLGLAMPAWVLIAALGLGAFGVWANTRRQVPVLRF